MREQNGVIDALTIFVDVRGFTAWAENVDVFPFFDAFMNDWHTELRKTFKGSFIKNLGDGAMIVSEINKKTTSVFLRDLLLRYLKKINVANADFLAICKRYSEENGAKIPLRLGWGVTKGKIKKTLNNDYIGADLNKCSRYCNIARPYGIVIDAIDFQVLPEIPEDFGIRLTHQKRKLKGIDEDLDVWVTQEISETLLTREEKRETPEVHIAGICFKQEAGGYYVLLAKRKKTRRIYPGLFEGCGGQLARNELFAAGVRRHYLLELGIEVEVFEDCHKLYAIEVANEPVIPGVAFMCRYINGDPASFNHEPAPRWYSENEFNGLPENEFIPGLKQEIEEFFALFKERS
jgi:class 3 adenylate cyclase